MLFCWIANDGPLNYATVLMEMQEKSAVGQFEKFKPT